MERIPEKQRILYVEDNPVHVENGALILSSIQVKWDVAESGREGILAVSAGNYSLVFLDINLPDTDGISVAKSIRKMDVEDMKLVALTSYTEKNLIIWELKICLMLFYINPLILTSLRLLSTGICCNL